jgi:hypothetical protein
VLGEQDVDAKSIFGMQPYLPHALSSIPVFALPLVKGD